MIKLLDLILILLFFVNSSITSPCNCLKYRLSGAVKPSFYSIKLHPDINQENFTGEVSIHIKIHAAVDSIEFHLNHDHLTVSELYLDSHKVDYIEDSSIFDLSQHEFGYTHSFELIKIVSCAGRLFVPGAHVIHIKYFGKFSQTKDGIFKTPTSKKNEILDYLIATDFEPSRARKVFPCFDEPALKAKFQVNLVVPNNTYEALSNMRVLKVDPISNGIVYRFETTPIMSTYLLSFAILKKNNSKSYIDSLGINYKIYSFEKTGKNDLSLLEFSSKVLQFFSSYTHFNYTLPKLDFLGFDRYESTATENWGLITFNSSILFEDDGNYVTSQKQTVIAHELAHSWFGNLVTNDWWNDIWLHESFATFMSIKAEEAILNNHESQKFPINYMETLFYTEQTSSKMPVVSYQENPEAIEDVFNDVSYLKGATILRMLELILGAQTLNHAMSEFVKTYAFKTATTNDFITLMEKYSSGGVREFMETYLYQTQFPLFYVEEDAKNFIIKQEIYKLKDENNISSPYNYRWTVPITYVTNLDNSMKVAWFHQDRPELIIPRKNAAWIHLNYNYIGYYRVNYSPRLWQTISYYNHELGSYNRDHLLLNAVGLFEIDVISCDRALEYLWELSNIAKSPNFNMEIASIAFARINSMIKHDQQANILLKRFFGNIFKRIGRNQLAERFINTKSNVGEENEDSSSEENQNKGASKQTENCINWILNKSSRKYYY